MYAFDSVILAGMRTILRRSWKAKVRKTPKLKTVKSQTSATMYQYCIDVSFESAVSFLQSCSVGVRGSRYRLNFTTFHIFILQNLPRIIAYFRPCNQI